MKAEEGKNLFDGIHVKVGIQPGFSGFRISAALRPE